MMGVGDIYHLKRKDGLSKFDISGSVFIQCQDTFDIFSATIIIPHTSKAKSYTVELDDNKSKDVLLLNIYTKVTVPVSAKPSVYICFFV